MNELICPRIFAKQAAFALAVICAGLVSRSGHVGLSPFWAKYAGDALWALMVFLLVGMILRTKSSLTVGLVAFAYSCATEFSQLYHAAWIDRIRHYTLGRLILGDTFAWADMAAYLAGIIAGIAIEQAVTRMRKTARQPG